MTPSSVALNKNRSGSSLRDATVAFSSDCNAVGFSRSLATATDSDGVRATLIGHNRRRPYRNGLSRNLPARSEWRSPTLVQLSLKMLARDPRAIFLNEMTWGLLTRICLQCSNHLRKGSGDHGCKHNRAPGPSRQARPPKFCEQTISVRGGEADTLFTICVNVIISMA